MIRNDHTVTPHSTPVVSVPVGARGGARTDRSSTAGDSVIGVLDLMLEKLGPGRILNCGAGTTAYERVDQCAVHVDHAAPTSHKEGRWVIADANALPFRRGAFQGALYKDILEHIIDPISALQEAHRVCAHSALLIATAPRAIPRAVWADPTHIRGFTSRALVQALALGGWKIATAPQRMGGFPGAGKMRLTKYLPLIMRVPVFGHVFGTNWLVLAVAERHT